MKSVLFLLIYGGLIHSALAASGLPGDINGNGQLDSGDAQAILGKAVSKVVLGAPEAALADVNGDGVINALDAILVLKGSDVSENQHLPGFTALARTDGSKAEVKLAFAGAPQATESPVQVHLLDLSGKLLSTADVALVPTQEGKTGTVTFNLPAGESALDLANYVVEVTGQTSQQPFVERRSLYQLVPRLGAHLFGPTAFVSGGRQRLRVVTEETTSQTALAGATIDLTLRPAAGGDPIATYRGISDSRGVAEAVLNVPAGLTGGAKLAAHIVSPLGEQTLEQTVQIEERFNTLLTTDKPLYQPGQTINIRTLTLQKPDLIPAAGREIVITVADAKGNKVFRQVRAISAFGVAAAEFALATELNLGAYTISAKVGESEVQKQVTVQRYSLPKFKVILNTDRPYYRPGSKVSGKVAANYFFGKPVSAGKVSIAGSKFDVGFSQFAQVSGATDADGAFSFVLDLPTAFVGQPLQQGDAFALFEVSVEDAAGHTEKITRNVAIAASDLLIQAVPENGQLVPGVENKVYVLTTYPDSAPAQTSCSVQAAGQSLATFSTDATGIGTFLLTPAGNTAIDLVVRAQDAQGNAAEKTITLPVNNAAETLLLRTDRTLYAVGDEILVDVLGGELGGSVFIDIVKEGQTIYSRTLQPDGGRSSLVIPVTAEMSGTLTVSAYRLTLRGDTIRDRKLVYVDPANQLHLGYELSKDTYLPGEEAAIRLRVRDGQEQPVVAAIGLNIVDESVFALQEMQPGMEKVYFYLEEQLRKPRYEIHGFEPDVILSQPDTDPVTSGRDRALGFLFASATATNAVAFEVNTGAGDTEKMKAQLATPLWKDLDPLLNALADVFVSNSGDRTAAFYEEKIKDAVSKNKLTLDQAVDPWGVSYRVRYQRDNDQYTFQSAGPDQRWGTGDDLALSAPTWLLRDPTLRQNPTWILRKDGTGWWPETVFDVATGGGAGGGTGGVFPPNAGGGSGGNSDAPAAPYLRQYFPETLYSNPAIITGPDGVADLKIKVADSITSWRLTGLASSGQGRLGSATAAFRTFQEFFVDLDLPPTLTRGDELSVPLAIYNYLADAQDVRLVLEKADWFDLAEATEKTVHMEGNQVSATSFRLKATKVGVHKLQVTAFGSSRSDALVRQVEVVPDGTEVLESYSGRLEGKVEQKITISSDAIEGASKILVKIYPGLFSQVVEGLDAILQMPFGCFEQTSSTTYPNVLALQYMKASGQTTPEIVMKAEGYIGLGYQRLLSFEVPGGGFEWFGNTPAHNLLTTYGLMEFSDMRQVWYVDPAVIQRTQQWLVGGQKPDGSWVPTDGGIAEGAINRYQNDVLRTTAYILWGLTASGYTGPALPAASAFIKGQLARTDLTPEIYTLALCAHALLSDPQDPLLPKLFQQFEQAKHTDGDKVWWEGDAPTITFSRGKGADVELTALLAQAYMRYSQFLDTSAKALNFLVAAKDPNGTFGSTQATVLALKAFVMAASGATTPPNATIRVAINQTEERALPLNASNKDLLFLVDLQPQTQTGENLVSLALEGTGTCLYQIVGRSYLPWKTVTPPVTEPISIDVTYDKTELTTKDTVRCTVRVTNQRPGKAKMVVIDTGIPPGFTLLTEDLDALVGVKFKKYQLTPRQAIFYLDELSHEAPVEFSFRLAAKYPIHALAPQSVVYEYYSPDVRAVAKPTALAVTE